LLIPSVPQGRDEERDRATYVRNNRINQEQALLAARRDPR
jgi:hypothetical protein